MQDDTNLNQILADFSKVERARSESLLRDAVSDLEKKLRAEYKKQDEYYLNLANKHADAEVWARMPQLAKRRYTPKGHDHPASPTGGADCMFDYLISECWDGPEGQEHTSLTGCPFKVYSHPSLAFTDANTNRQGTGEDSVFYICSGTYVITASMDFDPPNSGSYILMGPGWGEAAVLQAGADSLGELINVPVMNTGAFVDINGVTFDGSTYDSNNMIKFNGSRRFMIRDCVFTSLIESGAVGIDIGVSATAGVISRCRFGGTSGIGVFGQSGSGNVTITDCIFETPLAQGIDILGMSDIEISGNYIATDTYGVQIGTASTISSGITIQGNVFSDCNRGITIVGRARGCTFSGNTFRLGDNLVGIDFAQSTSGNATAVMISNNVFIGAGSASAIGVRGDTSLTHNSVISNNAFWWFDTTSNAIVDWAAANENQAYHNKQADLAGTTETVMADIGSPYGHSSTATAAPSDADYLVGTANSGLSAEIVVGTTPGGELGGTWASPTVDATHSGSAHHNQAHGPAQHTEGTAWRIVYQDANGDEQEIGLGTSGQVLTSAGASSAPAFATPAGGGNDDLSWIAMVM